MTETDADGTTQRWFIYGNYIDEVLLIKADSNDYYYAQDHLYSPAALINSSGSVVERYEYDAYGDCNIMDASYNPRSSSNFGNPYYFQGKRLDLLDNGGLQLMSWPYRNYSTYLGRWLQAEKLGMIPNDNNINPFCPRCQYEDGINSYEYVKSNPVIRFDPWGLSWCTWDFVDHYFGRGFIGGIWLWPGTPVDLADVGLLDAFKSAPSVVKAVASFKSTVDDAIWLTKISLKNCPVITDISGNDSIRTKVTWVKCLFPVGRSAFLRDFLCDLFPDPVDHCKWGHTCTLTFSIKDKFKDPLDMGFELLGGTTYPITASWSETYP